MVLKVLRVNSCLGFLFVCSLLTGSSKHSDIGSFGSSFEAPKADTSDDVALMPSLCKAPEDRTVGIVGPPIGDSFDVHPAKTLVTVVTSPATEGGTLNFKLHFPFS